MGGIQGIDCKARAPDSEARDAIDQPVRDTSDAQGGSEGSAVTWAAGEHMLGSL